MRPASWFGSSRLTLSQNPFVLTLKTEDMPANRNSPLCSTPSGTMLPLSPPAMSLASATTSASDILEQNPPDLVCPITHEIFTEPVINGAGQVYERAAIEMHMRRSSVDPVTRMQLHPSSGLTQVWIVKSRSGCAPCSTPKLYRCQPLHLLYYASVQSNGI